MKAIVRSEYGPPDVLALVEVAKPVPGVGELLVRVRASSVGMADVDYLLGRPKMARLGTGLRRPRNTGLGVDVAGVVESVGESATRFSPGDEVFGDMTEHGFGAYAEYVCAPQDAFALKPAGLGFDEAATMPQAAVMALQGLQGKGGVNQGDKVLINGAGGNVGPFAVQIAKAFGADVTGVDHTDKLEMLRSIGTDHVIDYTAVDYTATGERYDWILDIAPHHSAFDSRSALNPGGAYVMVPASIGQVVRAMVIAPLVSIFSDRKMGMMMWKPFAPKDVRTLTELVETGKVTPVIDRSYPLVEVADALRYQAEGNTLGKIVIKVSEGDAG
ncbi:MAG: NAD(P)-dependent alcohol dehydrogenase [bacterium]|nr:NAD(P)-dependent alcohol dehydrogenase [bacterium]